MNSERIAQIARELKPLYDVAEAAFNQITNGQGNINDDVEAWADAIQAYNLKFESYIPELATVTPNSEATLRQLLAPKDEFDTYLIPQELMNVANYNSFNSKLWTENSGLERAPTNNFTF